MAEGTVDSLQVEVTVLSDKAIASLNRLKDTLNGLKRTLGGVYFTPLTSGLKQIPEAAKRAENAIDKLKKKCGGKMDFSAMLTGAANANKKVLNVPGLDASKLPDPYEQSKGVLMKLPDNPLKQIEIWQRSALQTGLMWSACQKSWAIRQRQSRLMYMLMRTKKHSGKRMKRLQM